MWGGSREGEEHTDDSITSITRTIAAIDLPLNLAGDGASMWHAAQRRMRSEGASRMLLGPDMPHSRNGMQAHTRATVALRADARNGPVMKAREGCG